MPVSGWIQKAPEFRPPLRGDVHVDACVVGGGYTGLSAALALREEGRSVALLDREFAGHGASGRNMGHVAPTIGKDLPSLITFFGMDRAKKLLRYAEGAVEHLEGLIERYGIACDYVPHGNVIAGVHPSQEAKLRKACEAGKQLGGHFEWLAPEALRERGLPPCFRFGVFEGKGGVLDPGKYVLGLRQNAVDSGVQLYEQTPVTRIDDGAPARIETPEGAVTADTVVLATNAFTRSTGRLKHAVIPVTVTLLMTEALTDAQKDAIGWSGGEGIYTAHEILESYRWTADNRLMIGTKRVRTGFGGSLPPEDHRPTRDLLETTFRERFPELEGIEMGPWWSGHIALAMDFLPKIGVTGAHKNIYYSIGYAGHGLPQASYAGRIVADVIAGKPTDADMLLNRRIFPVPPEPIAWLYGKMLSGVLGFLDNRLDKKTRAAR